MQIGPESAFQGSEFGQLHALIFSYEAACDTSRAGYVDGPMGPADSGDNATVFFRKNRLLDRKGN